MIDALCKICLMFDTRLVEQVSGVEYCSECYSVEQGFHFIIDEDTDGNLITEDDLLLDSDGNLIRSLVGEVNKVGE